MLFHADADAFFASVAARDDASLRGIPMIVAEEVVACASYEARALGIHAGMPLGQVRRQWPQVRVAGYDVAAFTEASKALMALFESYTPLVEPGSMEEAFLDVTAHDRGDPVGMAHALRAQARAEIGLPVSIGIARTKLFAKLASRRAKPDGVFYVDDVLEAHVRPRLTLAELWGIGPTTVEKLTAVGLRTVSDLRGWDEGALRSVVSVAMARRLLSIHDGTDDATIRRPSPKQSMGSSRSIRSTRTRSIVLAALGQRVEAVCHRLDTELPDDPRQPNRLDVFVRFDDGLTINARGPLHEPTRDPAVILPQAAELLESLQWEDDGRGITMVGVTLMLPPAPKDSPGDAAAGSPELETPVSGGEIG